MSFFLRNKDLSFIRSQLSQGYKSPSDGDIIFLTGNLISSGSSVVKDETFGISTTGLKLVRKVEMLQWIKEKSQYSKVWSDSSIPSKDFEEGFKNPKFKLFEFENFARGDLIVDGFKVNPRILKIVKSWEQVKGNYMGKGFNQVDVDGQLVLYEKEKEFKQAEVGSYRITHQVIPQFLCVSLIGQIRSGRVLDYRGIFLAKEGTHNYQKIIEEYLDDQKKGLWIYRALVCCSMAVRVLGC
jgi:hypothetical protein